MPPAMTQGAALLILFVILPFVVAGGVIAFISWRSKDGPPPVRTSDVLATGEPGEAEVLSVRPMGGFLDPRPMVRVGLRISAGGGAPFDLDVTQSLPREVARRLGTGDRVEVRVTPDRTHAAIVLEHE